MKNKVLAVILSFLPGLGHMYLGYINFGLEIMVVFMALSALSSMSFILGFVSFVLGLGVPVLWLFCVIDVIKKCDAVNNAAAQNPQSVPDDIDVGIFSKANFNGKSILLVIFGAVLVLFGANVLLNNVIGIIIPMTIVNFIKNLLFSALLICGGIYILVMIPKGWRGFGKTDGHIETDYNVGRVIKEEKIKEDK